MKTNQPRWRDQLPLPVDQLIEQYPFSGPLQLLSSGNSALDLALFSSFPILPIAPDNAGGMEARPANSKPPEATDELLFEPYHTVDYFASQGIKPPSLENSADRFGQQLKSFTDWLKVMKRLPLTEVTRQIPVEKEKQVAALAHDSLDDKQVRTEAMAEVWIKQGEKQKAIRIYQELSLLDPSKSAYFAAKINELNSTS